MSKPLPPKCQTTNWKADNAALKARGSLMIWLDRAMTWQGAPSGKRGRSPTFSDAAIQFCLTSKCRFNLALRQAIGMLQSLIALAGLDGSVPDYRTLSRRAKHLNVLIPFKPTPTGLPLLVDSTGIKMLGEGEWKTKQQGAAYRRQWRKVPLGIHAETRAIRALEVTGNAVGDAPMLPERLKPLPPNETLLSVSGDGAYDSKGCHEAIARHQAAAIIPTRKKGRAWKENRAGADVRNEILRSSRRLGRAIWRKWSGSHRRSLVETKMRCFKLLGERVMARDFDRQVAELQVGAAILNRFTQLGRPMTVRMP